MDKNELWLIPDLKEEIEYLKNQMEKAEYQVIPDMVTDRVKGSLNTFPYTKHSIVIRGIDYSGYRLKVNLLKNRIRKRINELMDKLSDAYEYILAIDDYETRAILQYKFIIGLTWKELEEETGISLIEAKRKLREWTGCYL